MSRLVAALLVLAITGCLGAEPVAQPADQEREIAVEIARLGSSSKGDCAAAVKALIKIGKPASPALVKVLSDPRNDVRAFAAEALRSILSSDPTSAPNCHEKAFWEQRIARLKAGMTLNEALELLLPELSPAERRKTCQGMACGGGGCTGTYRLDDCWMIVIYSFDDRRSRTPRTDRKGLQHDFTADLEQWKLGSTPSVLEPSFRQVWVKPPAGYTGPWVTWHVNGQKANEIQYSNGQVVPGCRQD